MFKASILSKLAHFRVRNGDVIALIARGSLFLLFLFSHYSTLRRQWLALSSGPTPRRSTQLNCSSIVSLIHSAILIPTDELHLTLHHKNKRIIILEFKILRGIRYEISAFQLGVAREIKL